MLKNVVTFLAAIVIACLPGLIGRTAGQSAWYKQLDKPPLQPPGWVFGAVWPVLYVATGVALFLIWKSTGTHKGQALVLFAVQAILNAAWSLAFFGMDQPWLGLVIILALVVTVILCIVRFRSLSQWASWLFMPYLAWLLFATYLNIGIIVLN